MTIKSEADRFEVVIYDACEGWDPAGVNLTRREAWNMASRLALRGLVVRVYNDLYKIVWSRGSSRDVDDAYRSAEMRAQERAAGVF